ncbi:class I SAM-dependent methyltransferase [Lachnobacterium bovis]|uniref:class I SAM-dependent methyltransferase n=1 Tax=Lachnobacterium bovis TaxID=140626 RepID=UPI0003B52BAB|nr:class I SAM-dependent methyltransferase [Lachnobacterium bovis]
MTHLEEYYNKFNEDKRLNSRYGRIEYEVSMTYIHKYIDEYLKKNNMKKEELKILEVGAGTGRYCIPLSEEGYDVHAIELVKHNLGVLKSKGSSVKAILGNALKLKKYEDNYFDIVLVLGPMYHLLKKEEKIQALNEAKRVSKNGANIFVSYVMNDYAVLFFGIKEGHLGESIASGKLDETFHCKENANELYSYVRLEDIDELNEQTKLKRDLILSPDGSTNVLRQYLNKLTEDEVDQVIQYQLATCERKDLLGAGAHTLDILSVEK